MSYRSPYELAKKLETAVTSVLTGVDVYDLDSQATAIIVSLKRRLTEARLQARDYEMSDTREEQLTCAFSAKRKLEEVRKDIVTVSQYDVFSPVDVAQFSAQTELISDQLV
jgi:hypothetical protein